MTLKLLQIRVQNGVHKGIHIQKNVIKAGLESQKNRFATCVGESEKRSTSTCPERLDFDAPACTESLFSLLQICSITARLCGQKPSKLSYMGVGRSKKMEVERSRKTCEKHDHKSANICHKFGPKGGPPKVIFSCFFSPLPRWPPRRPPDGSRGPKQR